MKLKILLIIFLFFSFLYGEGKYVYIEYTTPMRSFLESLLIVEGNKYSSTCTRKYRDCRNFSLSPPRPKWPGLEIKKENSYFPIIELKVKRRTFSKIFELCKGLTIFSPYVEYRKGGSGDFAKKVMLGMVCAWDRNLIITVSEGKIVKQIFLDEQRSLFFARNFNEIVNNDIPLKVFKDCPITNYSYLIRRGYFSSRHSEKIFLFTLEIKSKKDRFIYCPIGDLEIKLENRVMDFLYMTKYPLKKKFFWKPERIKSMSEIEKVHFKYMNGDILDVLEKIREENREKGILISWNAPCVYEKPLKLRDDEVLLSIVGNDGVEYFKLKKGDRNIQKILNMISRKRKRVMSVGLINYKKAGLGIFFLIFLFILGKRFLK